MSAEHIRVVPESGCLRLRSIDDGDLELLRTWKNRHRDSFFHREIIEPEQQRAWYASFLGRDSDFMFVAEATCTPDPAAFGCMGFRRLGDLVDVYNIIRGARVPGQRCGLGDGFALMCAYAADRFGRPVTARVLKNNPALGWYEKQLFKKIEDRSDHYLMRLDQDRFVPVPYSVEARR